MDTLSLAAAESLAGISARTLRRYVAEGSVASTGERDARGRATLALDDALRLAQERTGLVLSAEDVAVLLQADAGDAAAQADMGALLYVSRGGGTAVRFIGCSKRPRKTTPRPCTGWAPRAPRPIRPTTRARSCGWPRRPRWAT